MTTTTATRPATDEYLPYYGRYIDRVTERSPLEALQNQLDEMMPLLRGLDEAQGALRYAPGKWSIKQVIGHVGDAERVFGYRAMRFARDDRTPLPGFDENTYAEAGSFDRVKLVTLVGGLESVRRASLALFTAFDDPCWTRRGLANDAEISVRALAYVMAGHARHHMKIIEERYLARA